LAHLFERLWSSMRTNGRSSSDRDFPLVSTTGGLNFNRLGRRWNPEKQIRDLSWPTFSCGNQK